jgi:hypothetical protein
VSEKPIARIAEQSSERGWCWIRQSPSGEHLWRCSQAAADIAEERESSELLIVAWGDGGAET